MSDQLEVLLDKCLEAVKREVTNLLLSSSSRKLNPAEARDLVSYTKLLFETIEHQKDAEKKLDELSEEELKELEAHS